MKRLRVPKVKGVEQVSNETGAVKVMTVLEAAHAIVDELPQVWSTFAAKDWLADRRQITTEKFKYRRV